MTNFKLVLGFISCVCFAMIFMVCMIMLDSPPVPEHLDIIVRIALMSLVGAAQGGLLVHSVFQEK